MNLDLLSRCTGESEESNENIKLSWFYIVYIFSVYSNTIVARLYKNNILRNSY